MKTTKFILFALMISLASFSFGQQKKKKPALSPLCVLEQNVATSTVAIKYSRPSARGRVIFGDLLPYGVFWRTGANAPTKITLQDSCKIGGSIVAPGTYEIFTIPNKEEWNVVLNKDTTVLEGFDHDKTKDVANFTVKSQKTAEYTEVFTIDFVKLTKTSGTLELRWENTKIDFDLDFKLHD